MTDDERIAGRIRADEVLVELFRNGFLKYSQRLAIHEECGGRGYKIQEGELTNYHRNEYGPSVRVPCAYCAGSGRVKLVTAEITIPYMENTK